MIIFQLGNEKKLGVGKFFSLIQAFETATMKSPTLYTVLLAVIPNVVIQGEAGLSDFGGDVSEYMSLLQGSSAFRY